MSSSFSSQSRSSNMSAFSQPFGAPPAESRNTTSSSSSSSANLNQWKSTSNIWSTNYLPSAPSARQNSTSRNTLALGASASKSSGKDVIEGRMGSGQLVDSSVSDDFTVFPSTFSRRDEAVRIGGPLSKPADVPFSQHRSNSNSSALPQAYPGATRNSSSFSSSRPTTSGLNSTASTLPKSQHSGTFDSPLSYANEPPPVFTKFDRPNKTLGSKPADSAYGEWVDGSMTHSPVETRRPSAAGYFSGLPSAPSSRNNSLPPSRHSDIQPVFPNPSKLDSYSSQPPAASFRVPSFSSTSRPSGSFGAADVQASAVPQFSHLSLQEDGHNHNPAPQRQSFQMPSYQQQPASIYNRSALTDQFDDVEEIGRLPPSTLPSDAYSGPPPSFDYSTYRMPQYSERSLLNGNMYNPRNAASNAALLNQRLQAQAMQEMDARLMLQYAPYPYGLPNGAPLHGMPPYAALHAQMPLAGVHSITTPKGPRELETGSSYRSRLLEEFKNNNKTRRYELKDIFDHVVEFSGDQHGSRFIQTKLETANSDDKEQLFREIQPNAIQLMTDVFGNYVIQKFFEHGDQNQKKILANKMKGRVLDLSLQMYGCRVVQKALEHILNDQQALLVRELERDVLRCVKDQNGNHVIQKAIERCDAKDITFIFQAFTGQIQHLSVHTYGCRVIQRCLENCERDTREKILLELHDCMPTLIGDSFGNYVAQHVVRFGYEPDRKRVLDLVMRGLEGYSKHKFASNVVEKCLMHSDDQWKRDVVDLIVQNNRREGETMLLGLMRDNYGNYVIQKLLELLNQSDFDYFMDILQPEFTKAKRTCSGKHITGIDRAMQRSFDPRAQAHQHVLGTQSISQNTTPPPPSLIPDTHSLQTSSVASVNGDALEGAASSRKGSVEQVIPTVFEG